MTRVDSRKLEQLNWFLFTQICGFVSKLCEQSPFKRNFSTMQVHSRLFQKLINGGVLKSLESRLNRFIGATDDVRWNATGIFRVANLRKVHCVQSLPCSKVLRTVAVQSRQLGRGIHLQTMAPELTTCTGRNHWEQSTGSNLKLPAI